MAQPTSISIYCDGGSRGNPGPSASAFIVYDNSDHKIDMSGKYLGVATNNVAEYEAVILALTYVKNHSTLQPFNHSTINLFLDSLLVVSQLNGVYKVRDSRLREYVFKIQTLLAELNTKVVFSHIPREKNKEADLLVNETLDQFSGK